MFIVNHNQPKTLFIVQTNSMQSNPSQIIINPQATYLKKSLSIPIKDTTSTSRITHTFTKVPHQNTQIKFKLSKIEDNHHKINGIKNKKHVRDPKYSGGRWKEDEHHRFIDAMLKYSNNWKKLQKHIKTRSISQVRSHAQKFLVKIRKTRIVGFDLEFTKTSIQKLNDYLCELSNEESTKIIQLLKSINIERKTKSKTECDDDNDDNFLLSNQVDDIKYILNGFIQNFTDDDLYDFDHQPTRRQSTDQNNNNIKSIIGRSLDSNHKESINSIDGIFD